jgi:hypothetical protein
MHALVYHGPGKMDAFLVAYDTLDRAAEPGALMVVLTRS